ncbi:MAG TPA: hypothetical protein VES95_09430 [Dermatophilaceae bacterium]|nr:hypothetical protein [Dermatophilaceae bacterium]
MIALGVLLLLLAAVAGALLFVATASLTDGVDIGILGGTVSLPPLALLITGAVVITVFWLGWALLRTGVRRGTRHRKEARQAATQAEQARVQTERRTKEEISARESELAAEQRRREEETAALRREADARVAEQHVATETARRRAEVAEQQVRRNPGDSR